MRINSEFPKTIFASRCSLEDDYIQSSKSTFRFDLIGAITSSLVMTSQYVVSVQLDNAVKYLHIAALAVLEAHSRSL